MNCHRARQLISPYLDQQLTGREMLALQDHFAVCSSCEREMISIRHVKSLLRGLREPRPPQGFSEAAFLRLDQAEAGRHRWRSLGLPPVSLAAVNLPKPQHGRRLASALAVSCLTVVSFALPFAPDAVHSSLLRPAPGAAFSTPAPTDTLLSGQLSEHSPLLPVSDLTQSIGPTPSSAPSGVLMLTEMETVPGSGYSSGYGFGRGSAPRSQDVSFSSTAQLAVFRPR